VDTDPRESDKLDPDPHQFADDKPKYIKYEPSFGSKAKIRIRTRIKVEGRMLIRIKVTSRIQIRIKVTNRIRIRIKVMRTRINHKSEKIFKRYFPF
jgi:hypothetical protein